MTSELRKWGDEQQYDVAPMQAPYDETTGVLPKVHLLSMSADPLGEIASACLMYEGKPVYSLADITDDQRRHYWEQARATHLRAPLEYVHFHFMLEGVDRAFTHQHVRQRTAVYSQESLRFAVVDNLLEGTSLPPSLHGTVSLYGSGVDLEHESKEQVQRDNWDEALRTVQDAYQRLVNSGMPAEEARGLLPHATATRIHYDTNLRNLLDHAGNRLCTQAQFHWRLVFAQIAQAIREYKFNDDNCYTLGDGSCVGTGLCMHSPDMWQFRELAKVFKPVCYEQGKCPFNASFDRSCSIRERVELFAKHGIPSSEWHDDHILADRFLYLGTQEELPMYQRRIDPEATFVPGIRTEEWALDPAAARR